MIIPMIGCVIALTFGGWMIYLVISGFCSGEIRHTNSTSTYSLQRQPIRFALIALLFIAFATMSVFLAVKRGRDVFRYFSAQPDASAKSHPQGGID
jgi:hypothetical protein